MNYRELVWFMEILWHTRPYLLARVSSSKYAGEE